MDNNQILKLGDIFRFKEQDFVFLLLTTDIMYVARIFDSRQTKQVVELYEKKSLNGHMTGGAKDSALYSFVILTTEEFNERMANFAKNQEDINITPDVIGRVNDDDLRAIKEEILSEGSPVAMVLRDYIKSLVE
jgi:hypothetical protein